MKQVFIISIVVVILIGIVFFSTLYFNETSQEVREFYESISFSEVHIYTTNSEIIVNAEIANTPQKQSQGLMFRENMKWNHGMLFIFDNEDILSFWMKDTLIPLDMIFIDKNFRIINIINNAIPCNMKTCPDYSSEKPAKYVLEVNAGFVKTNDIESGDFISINFNPKK